MVSAAVRVASGTLREDAIPGLAALAGPRPAILGHRGASAHAPENTVDAFRLAAAQGADGVELDVRRTADGELVVVHDPEVPGFGPVHCLDLGDLRDAVPDAPTFAEAMAACAGMLVNVEIKNSPDEPGFDPEHRAAFEVADWVDAHDAHDQVIVSSFNPMTVRELRAARPDIATGLLMAPGSLGDADVLGGVDVAAMAGHRALHPAAAQLAGPAAAAAVAYARRWELVLVVWTVDDPAEIRRLAGAGVAGIITNDPAGAREALGTAG